MKSNVILIRLLQFVTFALFLFMVLVYVGIFLLLPLDVLFQITRGLRSMGVPAVFAVGLAGSAVAYLGVKLWKMSELCGLVVDGGKQLLNFGVAQIRRYDALLAAKDAQDVAIRGGGN